ncbi:hypothetical protein DEO72_LG9g2932 [Vigna unguiculata]|uniref:Uncharacterized protein n=1 Tax=Vigna unguiculata TaxID=3917 RepID=A0A4D6N278_VIGUN|nr:hypothetical protein DEO72_LG9g2932 [Vigna unguiculata]
MPPASRSLRRRGVLVAAVGGLVSLVTHARTKTSSLRRRSRVAAKMRTRSQEREAIRKAWHHRRHAPVAAAAALMVVATGVASAASSGRRSDPCLARRRKREGDDSGSGVLAGDASGGGWRRRRRVSPAVGLVAAAPVLVARWLEASGKKLPFVK